ncbi:MAG: hypothetical protein H0T17_05140, partial [Propionibacteriales bacterium]|nr:hypothetical protein [Propionibacteriales bacterium]
MSLDRLRTYRTALRGEESSASYWHTLLQARRDVLRVGDRSGDRVALRDALTQSRALAGRNGA